MFFFNPELVEIETMKDFKEFEEDFNEEILKGYDVKKAISLAK